MADEMQDLPDDLQQFESLLRGCTPSTPQLERDRLMYLAGRASAEAAIAEEMLADLKPSPLVGEAPRGYPVRGTAAKSIVPLLKTQSHRTNFQSWTWPLASAALLLLSLTLGAAILFRHAETRIVYVTEPSPSVAALAALPSDPAKPSATPNAEPNYLLVRNLVLAHGVEALPDNHPTVSSHRSEEPRVTPLSRQDF
jgi:hypothetical protein